MKATLITLFCFLTALSFAQVQPNRNGYVHQKILVQSGTNLTSVNIQNYKGYGDTFIITQNTGSWLLNQDTGITLINATGKKIIVNGGIAAENCKDVSIIGFGSDSAYGFEFRGGQVTGNFQGMMNNIKIMGCRFTGGTQGPIWIKEEAPHACDYQTYWNANGTAAQKAMYGNPLKYLAPYYQDSIFFRHNLVDSSGGDAYFGSTGGIDGRDPVPCLSNQKLPTMQIHNFHGDSNYFNYLGRSVQLSIATGGTNTVNDNIGRNIGYEWAETGSATGKVQGGLRFGSGDRNLEVARNDFRYTNIYNYDLEEPNINFHDNYGDSCNGVFYHGAWFNGGQQLANVIAYASHAQISPLLINGNQMYHSSASGGINYAIYGGVNFNTTNDTCFNSGKISVLATPFTANASCTATDTTYHDSTYTTIHDTLIVYHVPESYIQHDSTVIIPDSIVKEKMKNRKMVTVYRNVQKIYVWYDTIPAHDSTGLCHNCAVHDTTIQVIVLSMNEEPIFYNVISGSGAADSVIDDAAAIQAAIDVVTQADKKAIVFPISIATHGPLSDHVTLAPWTPLFDDKILNR